MFDYINIKKSKKLSYIRLLNPIPMLIYNWFIKHLFN